MKANKSKMFPVPLYRLKAEEGAPFPLFLFLKRNDKFIPIRLPGDQIGMSKYELFLQRQHSELWVPNHFLDIYNTYLQYLEKSGVAIKGLAEVAREAENLEEKSANSPAGVESHDSGAEKKRADANYDPDPEKSEQAKLVKDVLEDPELSTKEKAQVLSAVSQDLMQALNQITTKGKEARSDGLKRCKEIADEILSVAAQNSNIYEEILALRNSQEDVEHSVIVGTMAAMFGMALGFTDEKLLADLTIGAIFHDIGLVRVKSEVMAKPELKWTLPERKEYEKHVLASSDILKESETPFHSRVFRMISEHHENYDGSGFPKGLKGPQIDDTSAVLHLANLFDRLCTGKHTGTDLSPAEAFDYIYELVQDKGAVQEVQPELVQRIFQFMLSEKCAAEEMRVSAEGMAQNAAKQNL